MEHETFDCLFRDHLGGFLATQEYRQLVRSGRRSMLVLFSADDGRLFGLREKTYSVSCLDLATKEDNDAATTDSSDDNEVEPCMGAPPVVTTAMRELTNFLRYDGILSVISTVL